MSRKRAYYGAAMGHTMEHTMSRKRAYMGAAMRACMRPYMAIYGGSNGPYMRAIHRPYMKHAMEHAIEQQWGILWRNNRPCYGAVMGHIMEQ